MGFSDTYDTGKYKLAPKDAVVLDLTYWPTTTLAHLRDGCTDGCSVIKQLADQIEAQTKPARIPEPGWGEMVKAGTPGSSLRRYFLNVGDGRWREKLQSPETASWSWDDLVNPELSRLGV